MWPPSLLIDVIWNWMRGLFGFKDEPANEDGVE